MMCECGSCEQRARRRCGGSYAVDGNCCGRDAKDISPLPRCAMFMFEREVMGAEGFLPRGPRLVGAGGMSQLGRCFGKLPAARSEPVAIAVSLL